MEKLQIPVENEPTNNPRSSAIEDEEHRREEVFHVAEDGGELPFDVPRD